MSLQGSCGRSALSKNTASWCFNQFHDWYAGPLDVPHVFARQLRQVSLEQRKAEAAKRVQEIIAAGPTLQQVLQRVKAATRQPEPYSQPSKSTISEVLPLT